MTTGKRIKPKNIILLRKSSDTGKNLFLVHDGTGRIEGYFQFVRHLCKDFNVYGIMPVPCQDGEDYFGPLQFSIAAIAEQYRQIVNQFIGDAPVYIAGWSTGGSIAFEMVYGWQKEGRRADLLVLLDVMPPKKLNIDSGFYNQKTECDFILPFITNAALKEKLRRCEQIRSFWNLIQSELTESDWMREVFFGDEGGIWAQIIPNYQQLSLQELFRSINIIRSYSKAGTSYIPGGSIETSLYYFHASHSVITNPNAWEPYCHEFYCSQVPGEHYTMLNNDNAPELSRLFNQVLDNI